MPTIIKRLEPYWQTADRETARLYLGNVTDVLRRMPAGVVQCVVTSPPYWGLRDYGTRTWKGGDALCDHSAAKIKSRFDYKLSDASKVQDAARTGTDAPRWRPSCPTCGAVQIDFQLGSEPHPDCGTHGQAQCGACFICSMVAVFRGVHRALRDDGVLWLNLGDTYQSGGQLTGIPWRVALALQADGWVLRSDVPWVKLSAMPESVTNRPSKALEYWFLLTKQMGYFYDAEAIRKRLKPSTLPRMNRGVSDSQKYVNGALGQTPNTVNQPREHGEGYDLPVSGRNFRNTDLWYESVDAPHGLTGVGDELVGIDATTRGYSGSHFATFSEDLIEPLIKCGTSEYGACADCGAPWERVSIREDQRHWTERNDYTGGKYPVGDNGAGRGDGRADFRPAKYRDAGWQPTCECHGRFVKRVVTVKRPVSLEREIRATEGWAPPGQQPHSRAGGFGTASRDLRYYKQDGTLRALPAGTIGRSVAPPRIAAQGGGRGGVALRGMDATGNRDRSLPSNRNGITGSLDGVARETETVEEERWVYESDLALDAHPRCPCLVLDPFVGSGTTVAVAVRLGRRGWGIDLSETYLRDHAARRVGAAVLAKNGAGELVAPAARGVVM